MGRRWAFLCHITDKMLAEQGLSTEFRASQLASGMPSLPWECVGAARAAGIHTGAGDPNCSPHACTAGASPAEPAPSPPSLL